MGIYKGFLAYAQDKLKNAGESVVMSESLFGLDEEIPESTQRLITSARKRTEMWTEAMHGVRMFYEN